MKAQGGAAGGVCRTIAALATVGLATPVLATPAPAHATPVTDVHGWLAWSSPGEACGDAAAFAARVERALGRSPALAAAAAHVNVTATVIVPATPAGAGGGPPWVGEVHLRDDDQRDLGSRKLDRRDASCQPLIEAMAVVTALALADDGMAPAKPVEPAEATGLAGASPFSAPPASEPTSPPSTPPEAGGAASWTTPEAPPPARPQPALSPPRIEPVASVAGAPTPPLTSSSRRWRSGVEGGAKLGVGLLPGVAFGAEVSAYLLTASGWRFFLAFGGWQRQRSLDELGRGASFQRLETSLGVCPLGGARGPWDGAACVTGDVGRLSISRVGFPTPSTQDRLVLDAGLAAALNRHLKGPLAVGVTLAVTAPLLRDRISYATTDGAVISIFRESPLAVIGGLRLSVTF